ncbi:hypothetical protein [Tomitella gaofuii]|uniref:DUF7172 family protein n=1 Tax=Tomitella gaofuii TaxID=2760083 RepID=UPI0015FA98E6|nr:hypothetical protein [Tomitella gaofuii]
MDRRVCIDPNLTTQAGALAMSEWSGVILAGVDEGSGSSTMSVNTSLPGELLRSGSLAVTNDAPTARDLMVFWTRPYVSLRIASPNAVQIRMKLAVDTGETMPPVVTPNPTTAYDAAFTAANDMGTDGNGVPLYSIYRRRFPGGASRETVRVPAGHSARASWSVYAWNPPPYANNAGGGSYAYAGTSILQAFWFPEVDG